VETNVDLTVSGIIIAGVLGFLLGLVAHDLAVQGLTDERPLRPMQGVCPQCGHNRGWIHFRCPECGRVVQREPVIAITTALMAVAMLQMFGLDWVLVPYLGFLTLSAALIVTDLEEFRIVDRLNLRGTAFLAVVLVGVALLNGDQAALLRGLGGAAAYFGGATLMFMAVRGRGFGAGDVKLAPILGLFTAFISWGTLGWAVFATAVIGGVIAFAMIIAGAAKMKTELPYGPPMILGSWLAFVFAAIGTFPIPS